MQTKGKGYFPWNVVWTVLVIILLLAGTAVRFFEVSDAPLDFHPTRQLHSALIARGMYYQNLENVPEWMREMAVRQWKAEGLIEPQVMERLSAATYQIVGNDYLWIPRIWAIFFWTLGGIFLILFVRENASILAAAGAAAVYMFIPYFLDASRSFQPEPLLVAALAASLWSFTKWLDRKTFGWALAAGLLSGLAIYVKSVSIFFLAPALAITVLQNQDFKDAFKNKQVWIIAALSILPYLVYHFYGVFNLGSLGEQFALRFFPQRWIDPVFYYQWLSEINHVFGLFIFFGGVLSAIIFSKSGIAGIYYGLVSGYILYGLVFSYHITTHDYYHMPMIIPVAAGIGLLIEKLAAASGKPTFFTISVLILALLIMAGWASIDFRSKLRRSDYSEEVNFWKELGEELGRDAEVAGLFENYGYRPSYWGWMDVMPWQHSEDIGLRELAGQDVETAQNIGGTLQGVDFFIVSDFNEFEKQPQLKSYLEENTTMYLESGYAVVYRLP